MALEVTLGEGQKLACEELITYLRFFMGDTREHIEHIGNKLACGELIA